LASCFGWISEFEGARTLIAVNALKAAKTRAAAAHTDLTIVAGASNRV